MSCTTLASSIYGAFHDHLKDYAERTDGLGIIKRRYADGSTQYIGVMVFERSPIGGITLYHPLPGIAGFTRLAALQKALEQKSERQSDGTVCWYEYGKEHEQCH